MTINLRDTIREEFKKCAVDPVYFITKYCIIQHPMKGKIPFHLYDFQQDCIKQFMEFDYNIILKGRQIGLSTTVAAYSLWMMLFKSDTNILVIATKQETAKTLVTKVRLAHQNLPSWLRGICIEDNKLSLRFQNGSQIKAVGSSPDSGRGDSISLLILDECAFIPDIDEIWKSAQATLSTGGSAILLSTPAGIGGIFYDKWIEAVENKHLFNDPSVDNRRLFNPIFLDWKVVPGRDQQWRDNEEHTLGPRAARQEHDADFLTTGNTVIDSELIMLRKTQYQKDPIGYKGFDGNIWIWELPDYESQYFVSADVARGDGQDYSAFHIFEVSTCRQVAEYKGKVDTKMFGHMLYGIACEYNDALLVVENASIGWNTIQILLDKNYKNLFYTEQDMHYVDTEKQYHNSYYSAEKKSVPGFTMSMRTRPLVVSKIDEYFRDDSVIIRSERTYNELFTFIWTNGKAQAMQGRNDDLTMSLGIGLWIRDTALRLKTENLDMTRAVLGGFRRIGNDTIYGTPVIKPANYPLEVSIGNSGKKEDFSWVLG